MSKIEFTKEDLENVAMLSRLSLTEEEKEKFLVEMKDILEYVGQVSEMASGKVEASGGENYGKQFIDSVNKNTTREDNVLNEANEYTEALLENAPIRNGDYVEVSKVLDKYKNKEK
ncbi:Aspartyl/glutamyl-tRNA(Asn/Gln) amidotransferase subunit C [bioreactor metagenome]|uniref:Aspartyl/glutamyl-tRNA(Asn/Gln) amidotransferase subunit C n=1 Tax=bioreactor metagenome TaxID=1076179 RepID=A0A644T618_9ZZZZ|nr:Asp-tRNA(Asn)/Glu-tRNA(Gln) amidotransferase subunit GatC [Candidatus Elulimicrobiales bacterium]